jgi:hypothetical protein
MEFKNCLNCPHKQIDMNLKEFYSIKSKDIIFENCSKKNIKENVLCFGVGRMINWQKVFDDFSRELIPKYSGAKK